jgi:D-sedoheptulose 7-phosphate isomerase
LLALSAVDHVVVFDELSPFRFLDRVRPDVHCKGSDYSIEELPEVDTLTAMGATVRLIPFLPGFSTTRILSSTGSSHEEPSGLPPPGSPETAGEREAYTLLMETSTFLDRAARSLARDVSRVANRLAARLRGGGTLLVCGNGGSASDAQHFAAEFVGRFRRVRAPWPALALTADSSVLTCIGNDFGFEHVFSRQVEGIGRPGDLLLVLSTSGRSPNLIEAAKVAHGRGLFTTSITGEGGPLASLVDHGIVVPSTDPALIQQAHRAALHTICALVEARLIEA